MDFGRNGTHGASVLEIVTLASREERELVSIHFLPIMGYIARAVIKVCGIVPFLQSVQVS